MSDSNNTQINAPHGVDYFPPASGWIAVVLLLAAYGFYYYSKKKALYRSNLYRRQALAELETIQTRGTLVEQSHSMLLLLKRVALQHFGRERVATLSGDGWWDFVEQHSNLSIDNTERKLYQDLLYTPNLSITKEQRDSLARVSRVWIESHQKKEQTDD